MKKTIIIIGLGNPGKQYHFTRHNIGKDFLAWFASYYQEIIIQEDNNAAYFIHDEKEIITYYVMPRISMNISGQIFEIPILKKICQNKENQPIILVIHDDLQLSFGTFKLRIHKDRGPRGHNGNRSIITSLQKIQGAAYQQPYYLSIGIDRPGDGDVARWVLEKFSHGEQAQIETMFTIIHNELTTFLISVSP